MYKTCTDSTTTLCGFLIQQRRQRRESATRIQCDTSKLLICYHLKHSTKEVIKTRHALHCPPLDRDIRLNLSVPNNIFKCMLRLLTTSRALPPRTVTHTWKRYTSKMSSINQFVADVQAADPSYAGESEKDKSEITKLSEQTEGYSKDLSVSYLHWYSMGDV